MSVDLKWVLIVSIFLSVMGFLVGISAELTDLGFNEHQVKAIIAIFVILLGIGNSINSVLIAFGMSVPNRLASAASVVGVKGIQVEPTLVEAATAAVGADAKITSVAK